MDPAGIDSIITIFEAIKLILVLSFCIEDEWRMKFLLGVFYMPLNYLLSGLIIVGLYGNFN